MPVLIDPKGADWNKYRGCDFITPNLKEMCEAAGELVPNEDEDVLRLAQNAREKYAIKNVVVTRSERGMTLAGLDGLVINDPATAQNYPSRHLWHNQKQSHRPIRLPVNSGAIMIRPLFLPETNLLFLQNPGAASAAALPRYASS